MVSDVFRSQGELAKGGEGREVKTVKGQVSAMAGQ